MLFITLVIILFINIFIRLVFSLRLEIISNKLIIYLIIIIIFLLRLITSLNYKIVRFEKIKSFREI